MEAGAELDEGGDAAVHGQAALRRLRDARHELQQGRFARAVLPDDPEGGSPGHLEGDAIEGDELLALGEVGDEAPGEQRALQGLELAPLLEAAVDLGHVAGDDGRRAHTPSA